MKNIIAFSVFCAMLGGWVSAVPAHKIHMKDGSVIRSDTVWEETLGYFLDDVSLYAYQKAGMPKQIVNSLKPLQLQMVRSEERLLQLIQQKIGADALQRHQTLIKKYIVKKEVVSYDKLGDTIHLERAKVKRIEYSEPLPSLSAGFIDPADRETQRAIAAEKAMLYERLRKIREDKSAYVADDADSLNPRPVSDYKSEMRKTQQRIKELERNPVGYFLRYYPELVDFRGKPSQEDCYKFCGGASANVEAPSGKKQSKPLISANSDEELQSYKRCMNSCLQGKQAPSETTPQR